MMLSYQITDSDEGMGLPSGLCYTAMWNVGRLTLINSDKLPQRIQHTAIGQQGQQRTWSKDIYFRDLIELEYWMQ